MSCNTIQCVASFSISNSPTTSSVSAFSFEKLLTTREPRITSTINCATCYKCLLSRVVHSSLNIETIDGEIT